MPSEGNMGRENNRRVGSVNGQRSTTDEHSRPIGSAERTVLRRGLAGLIHAAFLFLWFGFGADKGRGEVTLRTSLRSETNNKCEGLFPDGCLGGGRGGAGVGFFPSPLLLLFCLLSLASSLTEFFLAAFLSRGTHEHGRALICSCVFRRPRGCNGSGRGQKRRLLRRVGAQEGVLRNRAEDCVQEACHGTFGTQKSLLVLKSMAGLGFYELEERKDHSFDRWHPDKCLASGNAQIVEEAKEKFQEIQKAYSGLFLFSSQLPCSENSQDSFQELQQLFVEMFQDDLDAGFGGSIFHSDPWAQPTNGQEYWTSMGLHFTNGRSKCSNKRGNSAVNFGKVNLEELEHGTRDFYFGVSH
ncbi:hypothetical protein B296_00011792 [Ensete ventricosum]|uniref:Uncharacterized protein n=1 Tax=Ensete ventricosum TaxID=4639 RepID=A0A427AME1_ENSVE|nr:hypothetical protein B296_00011792 [Ensete ventricosum]